MSSLCSLFYDLISQNEIDLNNTKFVSTYLLPEYKIRLQVNATAELFKSSLSTRVVSLISYLRFVIRANNFISSLNTNALFFWLNYIDPQLVIYFQAYNPTDSINIFDLSQSCISENPTSPIAFFSLLDDSFSQNRFTWSRYPPNSTLVNGFYAACTPLEGLLKSTLDCLYEIDCLQLLSNFFPSINQVCFTTYCIFIFQ